MTASLTATRWLLPAFDAPRVARTTAAPRIEPDAAEQIARLAALEGEAEARGQALGHAAGHAAGYAQGLAEAEALVARLRGTLAALAQPLSAVDAELERLLVAITLESARRIAQQELHLDPAKVAAVVRDAVAALGGNARKVAVFVHPDDYAALAEALHGETQAQDGWRLVADPDVLPGGCRVDSEQASVVSSLDARAAGLSHTLLAAG